MEGLVVEGLVSGACLLGTMRDTVFFGGVLLCSYFTTITW